MDELIHRFFWWLVTLGVGSMISHTIWVNNKIKNMYEHIQEIKLNSSELLQMHKHPDDFGFGTRRTNELIAQFLAKQDKFYDVMMQLLLELRRANNKRQPHGE